MEATTDDHIVDLYDETYFQNGINAGVSCYESYRWLPEATIGMCQSLIDQLPIELGQVTLDYGCSRGYVVKSLGILHREAFGCDVSRYAIENCDPDVRGRVKVCDGLTIPWPGHFDWLICKDTLEHVPPSFLPRLLTHMARRTDGIFIVVPLAHNGEYLVRKENWDVTHRIREGMRFWIEAVSEAFTVEQATHLFPGLKESYRHVIGGHAFILGRSRDA